MTCKACGYDHHAMIDCKVAGRLRATNATVESETGVAKPMSATIKPKPSVAYFEHPNVYPNPLALGWDKIKLAKTSTQRSREYRSRKARAI